LIACANGVHLQVRVIALGCTADLLKSPGAKEAATAKPEFIPTLLNALEVRSAPVQETGCVALPCTYFRKLPV
jgi:hypothetical protein